MRSLRRFLILLLLSAFMLISFAATLKAYQAGTAAVEQALDQQLYDYAQLLKAHGLSVRQVSSLNNPMLAYQTLTEQGQLLERSDNAPEQAFMPLLPGYAEVNFKAARWRALAHRDEQQGRWILVAQRLENRARIADEIIIETILPTLLGLPIAGLVIWFVVGRGLSPLLMLSQRLRARQADDLEPIIMADVPAELLPVVESTNQWLARLKMAFEREKHFASDAAHELRTPISILKIHLHNLQKQIPSPPQGWQALNQSVQSLEHLVEQMLMLYRTSPDRYPGHHEPLRFDSLIQAVIARGYDAIAARQQQIALHSGPVTVPGNRFALEAMVQNLVANASKYTPPGGRIEVTLVALADQVRLLVEDSGPGIPVSQRARALERFHRLPVDGGEEVPGCGLGLAIVSHVVSQHGGSLQLDESPDLHGLRVQVLLPLPAAAQESV